MNMIIQLLEQSTQSSQAYELRVHPTFGVFWRGGRDWTCPPETAEFSKFRNLTGSVLRSSLLEILDADQREVLLGQGWLRGVLPLNQSQVHFEMFLSAEGLEGYFRWIPKSLLTSASWSLPLNLTQSVWKRGSVSLLVAPHASVQTLALRVWASEAVKQKKSRVLVFTDSESTFHKFEGQASVLSAAQFEHYRNSPSSCDLVVVDAGHRIFKPEDFEPLLRIGTSLMVSCPGTSLSATFDTWASHASALQNFLYVDLVEGLESPLIPVLEVLSLNDNHRTLLSERKWSTLWETVTASGDASGNRTLYQSLVQLITRRKVDLAKAFEVCPQPEVLDGLLKKIGF